MAKPRPTEIKLVSSLLDPDAPTSEGATELAIEIIEALDKSRGKRDSYIVVAQLASWSPVQAWGEFNTLLQAQKFSSTLSPADRGGEIRYKICRLESQDDFNKRIGDNKK